MCRTPLGDISAAATVQEVCVTQEIARMKKQFGILKSPHFFLSKKNLGGRK
ncbi:hypothetical protein GCM10007868_13590 [Gluconobacter frateurii]|uniref:Uncharacterized protein n=1 Tax=Gluconobacter frateurii NRIC 0228 TaxID=1307946 RepID=A0ABQ0QE78_9PROT|nr:hypothetical protein AA0228_2487 [Gluconobacter frateurii NRIC 0228]GLP90284.1 hypothetical protein GCM10007868_13590 [Gluconobacter frateurii]